MSEAHFTSKGNSTLRPASIIISYKKVQGHPRVTRIATTLAESGRDVVIVGLDDVPEREEFRLNPHVRGLVIPRFRFRRYISKILLKPLNTLQRWIDKLR
jgi:hypothetical protein